MVWPMFSKSRSGLVFFISDEELTLLSHGRPSISEQEIEMVSEVLRSGDVSSGSYIGELEQEFAELHGADFGVSFNSWTSAAYLLLTYLAESSNRTDVIIPSFTFAATANVVLNAGLRPIFVDIDPTTFAIDPTLLAELVGKKTLAVMPVHYAGFSTPDLSTIAEICEKHGAFLLEDCAESLGARDAQGRLSGSTGIGVFSMFATKNITSGEGGMVTTSDLELAKELGLRRGHGVQHGGPHPWNRNAVVAGHNFRLSNLNAALGMGQFRRLEELLERRSHVADWYQSGLLDARGVELPEIGFTGRPSWQMFPVLVGAERRNDLVVSLRKRGVPASVHFDPPVHLQTAYVKYSSPLPVTEDVSQRVITLPMHAGLSRDDVETVIDGVRTELNS